MCRGGGGRHDRQGAKRQPRTSPHRPGASDVPPMHGEEWVRMQVIQRPTWYSTSTRLSMSRTDGDNLVGSRAERRVDARKSQIPTGVLPSRGVAAGVNRFGRSAPIRQGTRHQLQFKRNCLQFELAPTLLSVVAAVRRRCSGGIPSGKPRGRAFLGGARHLLPPSP
jgi:hypothetical protein